MKTTCEFTTQLQINNTVTQQWPNSNHSPSNRDYRSVSCGYERLTMLQVLLRTILLTSKVVKNWGIGQGCKGFMMSINPWVAGSAAQSIKVVGVSSLNVGNSTIFTIWQPHQLVIFCQKGIGSHHEKRRSTTLQVNVWIWLACMAYQLLWRFRSVKVLDKWNQLWHSFLPLTLFMMGRVLLYWTTLLF